MFCRFSLPVLFLITAVPESFATNASVDALVVDATEKLSDGVFHEIQPALDWVCQQETQSGQVRRVLIDTSAPVHASSIQYPCDASISSKRGGVVFRSASGPVRITGSHGLGVSGAVFESEAQVESTGDTRISGNSFQKVTVVLGGGAQFVISENSLQTMKISLNGVSAAELDARGNHGVSSLLAAAPMAAPTGDLSLESLTPIAGNFKFDESSLRSLKLDLPKGTTELNVSADKSVLDKLDAVLCAAEAGVFSLNEIHAKDAKINFALKDGSMKLDGGKLGRAVVDTARCAGNLTSKLNIDFDGASFNSLKLLDTGNLAVDVSISPFNSEFGQLNVEYKNANVRVKLHGEAFEVKQKFGFEASGEADVKLNRVTMHGEGMVTNRGKLTGEAHNLETKGNFVIRGAVAGGAVSAGVTWNQFGGKVGANYEVESQYLGKVQIGVFGTTFDGPSRFRVGTGEENRLNSLVLNPALSEPGVIQVRNAKLVGAGSHIHVSDFSGSVIVDGVEIDAGEGAGSSSWGILAERVAGEVSITNTTIRAEKTCAAGCVGISLDSVTTATIKNVKVLLKGPVSQPIIPKNVLLNVDDSLFSAPLAWMPLILNGAADAPTVAHFSRSEFDTNPEASLMLQPHVWASFSECTFRSKGGIVDLPGSMDSATGGLLRNPLAAQNKGLNEKNVQTRIDWDGNGCADIPGSANVRDQSGRCGVEGLGVPVAPR